MKLHIDTDLGGDPDDACALVMMLGWPDVDIVGITTTLDPGGRRAGMVWELLSRAGRQDIPVAAGSGASITTKSVYDPKSDDLRYWGKTIVSRPAAPGAALELLHSSVERGATIAAIGSLTNLAMLEVYRPGALAGAPVVVMGGWIDPPDPGFPEWGPEADWNIQCDAHAAWIVARSARMTLATLSVAMKAHLTREDVPRLQQSGPLGRLLVDQSLANAEDVRFAELAAAHPGLSPGFVNFHWDPVAVSVAVEWAGVTVEEMTVRPEMESDLLRFHPDDAGIPMRVMTDIDTVAFREAWLASVERADANV